MCSLGLNLSASWPLSFQIANVERHATRCCNGIPISVLAQSMSVLCMKNTGLHGVLMGILEVQIVC